MKLRWIWFWLMVGNFGYQAIGVQSWGEALERSYVQATAIFAVWLATKITSLPTQHHKV